MNKIVISLIIMLSAVYGNANQSNPQADQQQKNLPNNFMQSLNKNIWRPIKKHPFKTLLGASCVCSGTILLGVPYLADGSFVKFGLNMADTYLIKSLLNIKDKSDRPSIRPSHFLAAYLLWEGLDQSYHIFTSSQ